MKAWDSVPLGAHSAWFSLLTPPQPTHTELWRSKCLRVPDIGQFMLLYIVNDQSTMDIQAKYESTCHFASIGIVEFGDPSVIPEGQGVASPT